jgi:hypothetical protein
MGKAHKLKTVNPYFDSLWDDRKHFEIRLNDRDYCVGDRLYLYEYDANAGKYLGRGFAANVGYMLTSDDYPEGLSPNYVVLGLDHHDRFGWWCDPHNTDDDYMRAANIYFHGN